MESSALGLTEGSKENEGGLIPELDGLSKTRKSDFRTAQAERPEQVCLSNFDFRGFVSAKLMQVIGRSEKCLSIC